jgi:hypothetical protein
VQNSIFGPAWYQARDRQSEICFSCAEQRRLNQKSGASQSKINCTAKSFTFFGATLNRGNGRAVYAVPFASRLFASRLRSMLGTVCIAANQPPKSRLFSARITRGYRLQVRNESWIRANTPMRKDSVRKTSFSEAFRKLSEIVRST